MERESVADFLERRLATLFRRPERAGEFYTPDASIWMPYLPEVRGLDGVRQLFEAAPRRRGWLVRGEERLICDEALPASVMTFEDDPAVYRGLHVLAQHGVSWKIRFSRMNCDRASPMLQQYVEETLLQRFSFALPETVER